MNKVISGGFEMQKKSKWAMKQRTVDRSIMKNDISQYDKGGSVERTKTNMDFIGSAKRRDSSFHEPTKPKNNLFAMTALKSFNPEGTKSNSSVSPERKTKA